MPVGINVEDDLSNPGFVLIEFVDPTLKGPALEALIADGGPDIAEPLTREKGAERKRYRVPEGNAAAAGLIDGSGIVLDDITQRGPANATGMVQPPVHMTHGNIVAPVVRQGAYATGYAGPGGSVTSRPADPVGQPPGEPTQTELAEYVHANEKSLREREGRPALTVPVITTATLPDFVVGVAVSFQLEATGSTPLTWSVSAGTLPAGLTLAANGRVSGTPSAAAAYNVTAKATNAKGNDTQAYTGTVAATPPAGLMGLVSPEPSAGTPLTPEEQAQADAAAATPEAAPEPPAEVTFVEYPTDSEPSMDWSRAQLDSYALHVKKLDTSIKSEYPAKADVLNAIANTPTPSA